MLLILTRFLLSHWCNFVDNSMSAVFPTTMLLIPLDFPCARFFQLQCCCYLLGFHMHSFSKIEIGKRGTRETGNKGPGITLSIFMKIEISCFQKRQRLKTYYVSRNGRVLKHTNKAACIRFCQKFIKILSIFRILIFAYLFLFRIVDLFREYYCK